MTQKNNTPYYIYIGLGIMYLVLKIIYVLAGFLCVGAIAHGAIPAVLTTFAAIFAIRENNINSQKSFWHWLIVILPLLVLFITPPFMYIQKGDAWIANGRLSVMVIYECIAIVQFILAIIVLRQKKAK